MVTQRKSRLRVVADSDSAGSGESARKLTVRSAADAGCRRDLLVALRARIASDIDSPNTPPRDLAALSRRLLEIVKEIEALDAESKVDDVGEAAGTPDEQWSAV